MIQIKEIEISYELTPEDFYEFGKSRGRTSISQYPTVALYFVTYTLFIFADFIYAAFFGLLRDSDLKSLGTNVLVRIAITFVLIGTVLAIINLVKKRLSKKVSEISKNCVICRHKIILDEKELTEITEVNISKYAWHGVGAIEELDYFIAIEISGSFSYIIPKRFFPDAKCLKNFLEAAKLYKQNALKTSGFSYLAPI